MISVMHWVTRSLRQKRLKQAKCISISVDDRADFRIVRYRCGMPAGSCGFEGFAATSLKEWAEMGQLIHEGVLGVFRSGGSAETNTIESHDIDKSQSMADSILAVSRRAFEDLEGDVDEDGLQQFLQQVRHFAADQGTAAQKCGQILANHEAFTNLVWVGQDPAHQVRIASKDPLHANENFGEQWQRLFNERHALIPDIQNSEVWKSRLLAAQNYVLQTVGEQGAGLQTVMRTLSFAKQRFDSTATPMMRYCCMIRAIAIMCAMQACDAPSSAFNIVLLGPNSLVTGGRICQVELLIKGSSSCPRYDCFPLALK